MKTITFTYEGVEITDPTMDESGRFEVNPIEYYEEPYITAWQNAIVIELQNLIDEEIVGNFCLEDTSCKNDLCRSLTIFKGDSSIQIFTPNHPNADEENEQFNTYSIFFEDWSGDLSNSLDGESNLTYVIDKIQDLMPQLK
jgi:hypothetical protein